MLVYDDTFVAVMAATTTEATALDARAYGSEHVLLGLLSCDDPLARRIGQAFPALTAPAVRDAVRGSVDDAPHLARLGLTTDGPAPEPAAGPATGGRLRLKHTPELQAALNQATTTWAHLRRTHGLPKERRASSAVLWLAVLEPSTRAARLLEAMGTDPDDVRTAVLSACAPEAVPALTWPSEVPVGPLTRFVHRVLGRTHVAR